MAQMVAGTRPGDNGANLRAAKIAAAIRRTRLRPSSTMDYHTPFAFASPVEKWLLRATNLLAAAPLEAVRPPEPLASLAKRGLNQIHSGTISSLHSRPLVAA